MIHIARKRQVFPGTIFFWPESGRYCQERYIFGQEVGGIARNDILFCQETATITVRHQYFYAKQRKRSVILGTHNPREASSKERTVQGIEHPKLFVWGHIGWGQFIASSMFYTKIPP
jgi:hypothetical protein